MENKSKTFTGYLVETKIPNEKPIKKSFFNEKHALEAFKNIIEEQGFVFDELESTKLPIEIKTDDGEQITIKSITKTL